MKRTYSATRQNKTVRFLIIILLFSILIILVLHLERIFAHTEIDDVTPGIYCEPEYIEKSDVLWVIPFYENKSIAENISWCNEILSLNKSIGMHGVEHTYEEFGTLRGKEYLLRGMIEFEKCFGYRPEMFKAPQLKLTKEREYIKESNMRIMGYFNQWTHKVYHCSDSDFFSNSFNDFF